MSGHNTNTVTLSTSSLDAEHLTAFKTALSNILSTPVAENTYAQIIDGLPVAQTWYAYTDNRRHDPIAKHEQLCPGPLEAVKAFREDFDINVLEFDTAVSIAKGGRGEKKLVLFMDGILIRLLVKLTQMYQNSSIGSRAFMLRLIEMLAIACHQMAVLLFETTPDGGFGSHKEAQAWKPKPMMLRPFGSSEATIPNPVPDPPPAVFLS